MSSNVLYDAPGPKARRVSVIVSIVFVVVAVAAIAFAVYQLWLGGTFYANRWDVFQDPSVWTALAEGLGVTLSVFVTGAVIAIVLGVCLALLRSSVSPWVRIPATIVLEFVRGMPVLLMILFVLIIFQMGAYWAVALALGVYNAAIIGEALRAGIVSLPRGQREGGLSIGLSSFRTRMVIEFPQAVRTMLPIIIAQLVVLLKDTALGYIVGNRDLIKIGRQLAEYFGAGQYALSFFFVMLAIYLALNLTLSAIARAVSKRVSRPRKGGPTVDGTKTQALPLSTTAIRVRQEGDGSV